jgi:branched-chain amino acid transport system ATP-binding protein
VIVPVAIGLLGGPLSEQNLRFATGFCDRAYVLEQGHLRYSGTIADLEADEPVRQAYLLV